jgi:hypothetical protein
VASHTVGRGAAGRDIAGVAWPRVYDLISRLWPEYNTELDDEFRNARLSDPFRDGVDRILAGYGSAWELGKDGRLRRVLPGAAQAQVVEAFTELSSPHYASALPLFNAARDAYDQRPRRIRDACSNAFDAMESVAKQKYRMPDATFGHVVGHIRQKQALNEQIIGALEAINIIRSEIKTLATE